LVVAGGELLGGGLLVREADGDVLRWKIAGFTEEIGRDPVLGVERLSDLKPIPGSIAIAGFGVKLAQEEIGLQAEGQLDENLFRGLDGFLASAGAPEGLCQGHAQVHSIRLAFNLNTKLIHRALVPAVAHIDAGERGTVELQATRSTAITPLEKGAKLLANLPVPRRELESPKHLPDCLIEDAFLAIDSGQSNARRQILGVGTQHSTE